MTTSSLAAPAVSGVAPRVELAPPGEEALADDVIALAELVGLHLDPWQRYAVRRMLRTHPVTGMWAAFEVVLVVARQNGKGSILEARQLGGLFVVREPLQMHSAHEFKTAAEAFRRILSLVENAPDLLKLVKRVTRSHGDEGIELKPSPTVIAGADGRMVTQSVAPRLRFLARTGGSGRGFSAPTNYMDEAFNLPEQAIGALMPTMSAQRNPQIIYTSSAVDQKVHPNGLVLARLRRRALRGTDDALCYLEWSADVDRYRGDDGDVDRDAMARDPMAWAEGNPALGIRITEEYVGREQASMAPGTFEVERLSVGDWPAEDGADAVIDLALWGALEDAGSAPDDPVAFAVRVAPNRSRASVGVAGRRPDGRVHVEVMKSAPGTGWVVDYVRARVDRWHPVAVAVDASSAAGSLVAPLQEAGVEVTLLGARDVGIGCLGLYDDAQDDRLRHIGQPEVASALALARRRPIGRTGMWAWDRADPAADITPLEAVTDARQALVAALAADAGRPKRTGNAFFL